MSGILNFFRLKIKQIFTKHNKKNTLYTKISTALRTQNSSKKKLMTPKTLNCF